MNTKRFGTFEGVFVPTVLSILGVVMYLRLGWVVGQAGLRGALIIIAISNLITLFTGLSIASITTNMRIGAGGAYAIISKSLGLEVGGAIGIPLYLSQAISVAFYITGFTECWVWLFPAHSFILVSITTWLVLLIISYVSARAAFRLQFVIMAVIAASLVSIFLGGGPWSASELAWKGLGQLNFWAVFAIFFPAVTGILAGVSMSGELTAPEKSIPRGALSAIVITFFIYTGLAFWFAHAATPNVLVEDTAVVIALSRWRLVVIAGIMGATLSSALSMFVASPRTLYALGKHQVVPLSSSFNHINKRGEPAPAILFTAFLALVTISLGTLNTIAGILTMFFLITYGTLNIAVFIEKVTGIASFRPTFRVPLIFSLLGAVGCFYAMFLINQLFGLAAIIVVTAIYIILLRREIRRNWPDVRKGLFIFIAEQALRIASKLPYHPKIWKPNLLLPVEEPKDLPGIIEFVQALTSSRGRVDFVTVMEAPSKKESGDGARREERRKQAVAELTRRAEPLLEDGVFVTTTACESDDFVGSATTVLDTLKGSVLSPNVLFIKVGLTDKKDAQVQEFMHRAAAADLGIMALRYHPKLGFGQKKTLNVWIRRGSPNLDLAILAALQLEKNWEMDVRLIQAVSDKHEQMEAISYLAKLKRVMRLPASWEIAALLGTFDKVFETAPAADVNIFGMPEKYEIAWFRSISDKINTSALFIKDSTQEKAAV